MVKSTYDLRDKNVSKCVEGLVSIFRTSGYTLYANIGNNIVIRKHIFKLDS